MPTQYFNTMEVIIIIIIIILVIIIVCLPIGNINKCMTNIMKINVMKTKTKQECQIVQTKKKRNLKYRIHVKIILREIH